MSSPVDDVFGGGGPELPPVVSPVPRLWWWLALATVLVLVGPCCCTGVPGGGLAIWVWTRADDTLSLVENGTLPDADAAPTRRLRTTAFWLMAVALVLTILQLSLYGMGGYEMLLKQVATWLDELALQGIGTGAP